MEAEPERDEAADGAAVREEPLRFPAGSTDQQVEQIDLPANTPPAVLETAIIWTAVIAIIGLVIGGVIILCGVALIILGVSGTVTWEITGGGISTKLQTGVVGVVIAVIGLLVVFFSRQQLNATHKAPSAKAAKGKK
jgi:hypothetical protein